MIPPDLKIPSSWKKHNTWAAILHFYRPLLTSRGCFCSFFILTLQKSKFWYEIAELEKNKKEKAYIRYTQIKIEIIRVLKAIPFPFLKHWTWEDELKILRRDQRCKKAKMEERGIERNQLLDGWSFLQGWSAMMFPLCLFLYFAHLLVGCSVPALKSIGQFLYYLLVFFLSFCVVYSVFWIESSLVFWQLCFLCWMHGAIYMAKFSFRDYGEEWLVASCVWVWISSISEIGL